jgi:hypothetical protein
MTEAGSTATPRALLFDAQLTAAAEAKRVSESQPAGNPNDNDDH